MAWHGDQYGIIDIFRTATGVTWYDSNAWWNQVPDGVSYTVSSPEDFYVYYGGSGVGPTDIIGACNWVVVVTGGTGTIRLSQSFDAGWSYAGGFTWSPAVELAVAAPGRYSVALLPELRTYAVLSENNGAPLLRIEIVSGSVDIDTMYLQAEPPDGLGVITGGHWSDWTTPAPVAMNGRMRFGSLTAFEVATEVRFSDGSAAAVMSKVDLLALLAVPLSAAHAHTTVVAPAGPYSTTLANPYFSSLIVQGGSGTGLLGDLALVSASNPGNYTYKSEISIGKTRLVVLPPDPSARTYPPIPGESVPIPGTGARQEWGAGDNTFITWAPIVFNLTFLSEAVTPQGGSAPSDASSVNQPTTRGLYIYYSPSPSSLAWAWNDPVVGSQIAYIDDSSGSATLSYAGIGYSSYHWTVDSQAIALAPGAASDGFTLDAVPSLALDSNLGQFLDVDWYTNPSVVQAPSWSSEVYFANIGALAYGGMALAPGSSFVATVQEPDYRWWIPEWGLSPDAYLVTVDAGYPPNYLLGPNPNLHGQSLNVDVNFA